MMPVPSRPAPHDSMGIRSALLLLALVGCAAGPDEDPLDFGPAARVVVLQGDSQTGVVHTELAQPIRIQVLDAQGRAVAGQIIS